VDVRAVSGSRGRALFKATRFGVWNFCALLSRGFRVILNTGQHSVGTRTRKRGERLYLRSRA
jgi:hypothetical protein